MPDDMTRLYPDVTAAGGLTNALQASLVEIGSALRVSGRPGYPRVEAGPRFCTIDIGAKERLFLMSFWCRGVMLAQGRTPDLSDAARTVNQWVGSDCTTAGLSSEFAFVEVQPDAESYERGEEVEWRWRHYLTNIGEWHPELVALVQAAAGRRELRQLFPYTSHFNLCFSRCTGYPYSQDTPIVCPQPDGQYEVVSREGHVIGRGDAEAAVRLAVEHLPAGCGSAIPGTAADLLT